MTLTRAAVIAEIPPVPLTIEGYSVLHQMMRVRWTAWRGLDAAVKDSLLREASERLSQMQARSNGQSAVYSLLGHKGDLMLVHFRESFDALNQAELEISQLGISDYLEPTTIASSLNAVSSRIRKNGSPQLLKPAVARKRPCGHGCSRIFHRIAIFPSIRWIAVAAKTRTGTHCQSKNVGGR